MNVNLCVCLLRWWGWGREVNLIELIVTTHCCNVQTSMYRNLESTERPLMPTKVLITYHHFLVFARHTYLRLMKKLRVISNKGLVRWTLTVGP